MKTIMIIINGIHLPYHVIHYAIEKAKENSCGIFALFLRGSHEHSKGYGFPSDLSTASWASDAEAKRGDERIITDNMELVKNMIVNEKIVYNDAVKTNASIDEVAKITSTADLVLIDEKFDDYSLLGDDKISLKALMKRIHQPVEKIRDES